VALWHQARGTEELHVIKEITEKDCASWRVVKPFESDKVSVSEDKGFEEIDALVEVEPHSLCQLSSRGQPLSNSTLGITWSHSSHNA
jgi:hypothetical protein